MRRVSGPTIALTLLSACAGSTGGGVEADGSGPADAGGESDGGGRGGGDAVTPGDEDSQDGGDPDAAGNGEGTDAAGGEDGNGADPLVVETSKGLLRGSAGDGVRSWLGIPFAAAPLGDLRFRPPAPVEPWEGVREATEPGPRCLQTDSFGPITAPVSEDCLTLNVWAPEAAAGGEPLPVMVWLHGGAFVFGSGSEPVYDGANLAALGVVVVTTNYRLGPLGFLAHGSLLDGDPGATPNAGLLDQRAALEWVKDEIEVFGGDPGRVTLFGESAGAVSACLHLVLPGSKGLFHRAILESGPCAGLYQDLGEALEAGAALAEAVGCEGSVDPATCLREVDGETLLGALDGAPPILFGDGPSWGPVADGVLVPEDPGAALSSGAAAGLPVLVGNNRDEGTLFVALGGLDLSEPGAYEAMVEADFGAAADLVLEQYPAAAYETPELALAAILGDLVFVCPTRRVARLLAEGGGPVFRYEFRHPFPTLVLGDLGAFHAAELPFVFGNPFLYTSLDPSEFPLRDAIQRYWTRFAATGDPNGGDEPPWPAFDLDAGAHLVLDLPAPTSAAGLGDDVCALWEAIGP